MRVVVTDTGRGEVDFTHGGAELEQPATNDYLEACLDDAVAAVRRLYALPERDTT